MQKKVTIIGGGIIGLSTAYFLQKEGCEVTIIDRSNMDSGASYTNAGYICPSHFIPLAAPGVVRSGLRWMLDASSPLYIKPSLNSDFLKWVWAFNKSATSSHVQKNAIHLRDFTVFSQELFQSIKKEEQFSFQYDKKGLLMLCQTERQLEKELEILTLAKSLNVHAKEISKDELKILEPSIEINGVGGVYFKNDHHTTPSVFMQQLKAHLKSKGVRMFTNETVVDFKMKQGNIDSVVTDKQTLHSDEFVMASGSWSADLCKKLGLKLLLQAGKGYSMNTQLSTGISIPTILAEAKIAVTPMDGFTRFAGTMEIAGINQTINRKRVEVIAKAATHYYPSIQLSVQEIEAATCGLRPLSPDGLPYLGKPQSCENMTIATGHAMLGWTLGPGTGKLVSELILNKKTSLELSPYHPNRRF
ncbi:D-amino acid dehydrogenase [Formosa sp. Hel1_33_131]|jgi:D-amino-acid dehydrogenase|uniref:NAD(P)/FAD-dependent oxidoreductase n=1 Tax=Formosa sp. Hel1_33_131 TaxID=1336794 RepID=UPI00084E2C0F|nr:FAD-dependent oxidoreductase [Formosa sp. Hel1_33_131]AOR27946.1 D-amino acid dehydrogenase [Formosa sp. Hel1_33_131]